MAGSGLLVDYLGHGDVADRPVSLTLFADAVGLWWSDDTSELSLWDGAAWVEDIGGGVGSGDVVGPASSTADYVALFDGTTGKLLKQGSGTLGTAAYTAVTDYATAAQGATADSALQDAPSDGSTYGRKDGAWEAVAGSGDVVGPASAVDDRIATYDSTTGKLLQDGGKTIAEINPVGKHAVPVMAGAMSPSATGGCAALATIASAANQPDIQTLDFDPTTVEYAQFAIPMPKSWNEGTVTFAPIWSHAATTTNFGVVFQLQGVAISNDDTILANYGTVQTSTDTGGTTSDVYIGPESSAITLAGTPAAGDVAFFRIARLTTDGSDTMAIDARLHGIVLYITTDAATDA